MLTCTDCGRRCSGHYVLLNSVYCESCFLGWKNAPVQYPGKRHPDRTVCQGEANELANKSEPWNVIGVVFQPWGDYGWTHQELGQDEPFIIPRYCMALFLPPEGSGRVDCSFKVFDNRVRVVGPGEIWYAAF